MPSLFRPDRANDAEAVGCLLLLLAGAAFALVGVFTVAGWVVQWLA